MNKQLLMDFLVVLVAPICFVAAYHFLLDNEITTDELLAVTTPSGEVAMPGQESAELGAKSKEILTELKSIQFDESFFSDPAFLSLVDFTPEYATTSVGRDYPFTIPESVKSILSQSSGESTPVKGSTSGAKSLFR